MSLAVSLFRTTRQLLWSLFGLRSLTATRERRRPAFDELLKVLQVVIELQRIDVTGAEDNLRPSPVEYLPFPFLASMEKATVFRPLEGDFVGIAPFRSCELLSEIVTIPVTGFGFQSEPNGG